MQTASDALQMLFKGEQIKALKAKAMGLVHAVVPRAQLLITPRRTGSRRQSCRALGREGLQAARQQGLFPAGMQIWPPGNAIYRRETFDNYPAARAILQCVYEGLQLPMDRR
jgi:3-hydroxyacyl-CoA dehydrogenase/enoyl-CoA hydratase/3-hydroxybutyryl-CoA epimerase